MPDSSLYDEESEEIQNGAGINREVTMTKEAGRSLNDAKIRKQIETILSTALTPSRKKRGWSIEWDGKAVASGEAGQAVEGTKTYTVTLMVRCNPDRPRGGLEAEFGSVVSSLASAGNTPKWSVATVDGHPYDESERYADFGESEKNEYLGYAPCVLPSNPMRFFSHIYDRDLQIETILDSIQAAIDSDWSKRFHVALIGPPACGKTEILLALRTMLGNDAVLAFDCTAITQAGVIKVIAELDELPRIIIFEEIEKADPDTLRFALSLLDKRGEIRKTTARGNIQRDAKCLGFATVNDVAAFRSMQSGALASRFAHQIFCPRPTRELMRQILHREVVSVGGNVEWIEPTLDYCLDTLGSTDPRKAIAVCLTGKDKLLNGSFQRRMEDLRKIETEFVAGTNVA